MSKTCETCNWFQPSKQEPNCSGSCFYEAPPWGRASGVSIVGMEVSPKSRCSKWETKLERRCNNCEHFSLMNGEEELGECRRSCPVGMGAWLKVFAVQWCGEFRGKE
jgi:hypothetical protein